MSWNYRVMRHSSKNPTTGETEVCLAIHEVHCRDVEWDGLTVDVNETSYTEQAVRVIADDVNGLRWVLRKMAEALDKPILDYGGSPEQGLNDEIMSVQ